jgi:flavodoxin
MNKVLIVYDSEYESTHTAAEIARSYFSNRYALEVNLQSAGAIELPGYDFIIVGSPVHSGKCSARILEFLEGNRHILAQKPVAFFFTCMRVKRSDNGTDTPIFFDPGFRIPRKPLVRLAFMEKMHSSARCMEKSFASVNGISFVSIAFFKRNMDTRGMSLPRRLIMKLAMHFLPDMTKGSFINPAAIHEWADSLVAGRENK